MAPGFIVFWSYVHVAAYLGNRQQPSHLRTTQETKALPGSDVPQRRRHAGPSPAPQMSLSGWRMGGWWAGADGGEHRALLGPLWPRGAAEPADAHWSTGFKWATGERIRHGGWVEEESQVVVYNRFPPHPPYLLGSIQLRRGLPQGAGGSF